MQIKGQKVLIFGGAGLVGIQVAKALAGHSPSKMVIASLHRGEARETCKELLREFPDICFEPAWGDIFVRDELCDRRRREVVEDDDCREALFDDTFGPPDAAYGRSTMVKLITKHRPAIIVDCVNTATGISYQDIFTSSLVVKNDIERLKGVDSKDRIPKQVIKNLEVHLLTPLVPQLVRHVMLLYRACREAHTGIYVKIGTTGTGGMGLNIPYTHGEDKPSTKLMAKTSIGFAHTGLLFLLARSPDTPIIKEIKPGAMIGYKNIGYRTVQQPGGSGPLWVRQSQTEKLDEKGVLDLSPLKGLERLRKYQVVCVNTGENGIFSRGEFEAITHLHQMEFVTPEEIADIVSLEVLGRNTGYDVISAVDSSVLNPSYRAGFIRHTAMEEVQRLEAVKGPSVAIGQLGPPQLAKYLFESQLLKETYGTLEKMLRKKGKKGESDRPTAEISRRLFNHLKRSPHRETITSIGIPILHPDGRNIWRGERIKVPEFKGEWQLPSDPESIDGWAKRGWIDLRPEHMAWWQKTMRQMLRSHYNRGRKWSSEYVTRDAYLYDEIHIGEVVAWIFNNDPQIAGYRVK
ncbi:MAG: hypothetical protein P9M14_04020 [Candidatus Alcyoniella australis]|nr:hypothetical protein [Candidatus Alcyoniella australis]